MEFYYDYWLVALSFLLAVLAAYTALSLAARLPHLGTERIGLWLGGGAFTMGIGIWAMHFVGMLAFHLPIPLAYDLPITLLSMGFAIVASAFALYLIRHGIARLRVLLGSAALMGSGIAAMHYTGMAALRMSPAIHYDPPVVVLSLLIAYGASLYALKLAFHQRDDDTPLLFSAKQLYSALVMGSAIAGMHYVAMEATAFAPGSVCLASPKGIDNHLMALIISSITLLLMFVTMLVVNFDQKLARQNAQLVKELREHNLRLDLEARQLAESMVENVRESNKRDRLLATVVEQSSEAIITTDLNGRITSWNPAAETMFGYPAREAIGMPVARLGSDNVAEGPADSCEDEISGKFLHRTTRDGSTIFVTISTTPLLDTFGEESGEIQVIHDVTREKSDHDQLLLWSLVYKHSGEAIIITDNNNRILSVNRSFNQITGYSDSEVIGQNPRLLASGLHGPEFYRDMWQELTKNGFWKGEIWNRRKDGTTYPEWITITTLRDAQGKICNFIAIFSDASTYKEKEARIQFLAHHDALTGLPNRVLLQDRLEQAISKAVREKQRIAVLFIDLDRFKVINDTLGHHVGDLLLKEIARRLGFTVRASDTICRQGGDEFIIILPEIASVSAVAHIAGKLLENISREFQIDAERLQITPSIGISLYPDDATDIDTLIRNADAAMYHAKAQGRANYQFFTESLNAQLTERLELERNLATAIERNQLELHFQPQFLLPEGRIIGAEALLRWRHPDKGYISPELFIPVAEESGLIDQIGLWVLKRLLERVNEWHDDPLFAELVFAANVSARQLASRGFIEAVESLLAQISHPPERIELELTETAVMSDIQRSITHLGELKRLGVNLAIDDFGTGYSSLNYLKRLPIDRLKIDRSFITGIPTDPHDITITRAIITMAQTLGLQVIAEGVETADQASFLVAHGCNEMQGFHLAHPLNEEDFADFVRSCSLQTV